MSKSYLTEQHLKGEERVKFESGLRDVIRNLEKTWIDEKVRVTADDADYLERRFRIQVQHGRSGMSQEGLKKD